MVPCSRSSIQVGDFGSDDANSEQPMKTNATSAICPAMMCSPGLFVLIFPPNNVRHFEFSVSKQCHFSILVKDIKGKEATPTVACADDPQSLFAF